MKAMTPTQLQKTGNYIILLSWTLFVAALALPAGTYSVLIPYRGTPFPTMIYGWTALLNSLFFFVFSPFFLIRQLERASGNITAFVLAYFFVAAFIASTPIQIGNPKRILNRRILTVSTFAILISMTSFLLPDFYVKLFKSLALSPFLIILMLALSLSFCLNSFKARLYLNISIFMLLTPMVVLLQTKKDLYVMTIVLPSITLGTLLLILSTIKMIRKKPGPYLTWVTINLAIANRFMPFGIHDSSPAFIAWSVSIIALAIGNHMRNVSLSATEQQPHSDALLK